MRARLGAWAPALLWALLIFAASSRPTLPVALETGFDKIAHFFVYLVLGLLLARAAPRAPAVALGWLYAASDELHQAFVPGRSAEPLDWLADALGVVAGVLLFPKLGRTSG